MRYGSQNIRDNAIPVRMAMVKLANVPINTYSVVRISFALFNSPKRKTDFAANRKPTPSKLPTRTNVSINQSIVQHWASSGHLLRPEPIS